MPTPQRSSIALLRERLDQLAGDIFALEVNTVIKPNMTVTPWPGAAGGILDIASEYSEQLSVLLELLEARAPGQAGLAELHAQRSDPANLSTFMLLRFDTLRERASRLCAALQDAVGVTRQHNGPTGELERGVWMAARIRENSAQIKGLVARAGGAELTLTRDDPASATLELPARDMARLRKIWEIGVEEVVAQTVIHLDGDVVLRIQPDYALPEKREVMQLHNTAVQTAVGFWQTLIGVIGAGLRFITGA